MISNNSKSSINAIKVFKDSIKFVLTEADLTTKKIGDELETPLRVVPCTRDLQWQIHYYPAGYDEIAKEYISIFTVVTAPTVVKSTFSINGSSVDSCTNLVKCKRGYHEFASHKELQPLFRDGKITITCDVEIYVPVPWLFITSNVFQSCEHIPTDFTLIVGDQRLESHRHFLSFVSTVFQAMLSHDTVEKKTGTVTITDFEFPIVQIALDFLYGREVVDPTIDEVIGVLRFADKYNISFLAFLEPVPLCNISLDTFSAILHYAYDCSKDTLLDMCSTFLKDNQSNIKNANGLNNISHEVIINVIEAAFDLSNKVDVLRQAHEIGIDVVKDTLALTVAKLLDIENFSDVANCAWDCSSDYLKEKCVQYLNQHWV